MDNAIKLPGSVSAPSQSFVEQHRKAALRMSTLTENAARAARETLERGGTIFEAGTAYNATLGYPRAVAQERALAWMISLGLSDPPEGQATAGMLQ